jgi:DNA-binding transcriptional ArsR family regulator
MKTDDYPQNDLCLLYDLDRLIHELVRLMGATILSAIESVDVLYPHRETGLTKGNLIAHLSRLEQAGYIKIEKSFKGKLPSRICELTAISQRVLKGCRRQLQGFVTTLG